MNNIGEVKKILRRSRDSRTVQGWLAKIETDALEIRQLFEPKPDESRLLTESKIDFEGVIGCACDDYRIVDKRKKSLVGTVHKLWGEHLRKLVNDELAKTAPIRDAELAKVLGDSVKAWHERLKEKDAECQERVERIFPIGYYPAHLKAWADQLEREYGYHQANIVVFLRDLADRWQALKKQEQVSDG